MTIPALARLGLLASASLLSLAASAQAEDVIIKSHGYNYFGALVYPADYPHLNYVNPEAPKGGEIAEWAPGTFDSFNLYTRKGRAGALSTIGHEDLLTTFADDPTALYCLLCETLEYPESLDWVIFNLRPEVRFADGTPWKASDLKFTYDIFMEQGLPSFRAAFGSMIDSVEVLGEHQIRFNFKPDSPKRDRIGLAGIFPAFSQDWFEKTGARLDESTTEPFMGTGAYALDRYDFNERIVYKRRDDYWGKDLPQNVGRNNFDRIRIEYFADSSAAFEAFKAGTYTFRTENSSKEWATGYDFPALNDGHVVKTELPDGGLGSGQSFVFNLRRDKFDDIRVRQAIGLMFNFEWSNTSLFYGLYDRTESFWDNSDMKAAGAPTEGELAILKPMVDEGLLEASILTDEAVLPGVSGEDRPLDRKALRQASALLDEAGWIVGDDGLRRKDGEVLTVEFLESSPTFDRVINPYVQNLERLGVQAKLDRVDPAQETERTRNYDFDLTTHQFAMAFEPSTGLKQWFSSETVDDSSRNLMGLADPAVDRLIDIIVAAETQEDMKNGVRALDRVLRAKLFWVPQWNKNVHTVAYFDQFEHPELPPLALGELDFWWFNQEKHDALVAAGVLR
ncbi:extracellular solute-binding protein [Pseudoprimorskyibacter insulae]|uniref:Solute-binding protein family 5 domain-containing protein n=1 Tax=Pseudoprimorskyibacter insulae TaxID=1695997 RepID=A0A2R8AV80_9RHOB|nr:extracellular solute-binding protein [Pseudoprimorskyibacter insulae]SPF79948.1 hypothetical protein PRI8871_01750 [Pseudoprimorskyibacter insulae]